MKKVFLFGVLVLMMGSCMSQEFKNGDIIFHTSKSTQSKMIQTITKSNLTHCGIIFYMKGKPFVFEAVQPVKITPLRTWIDRGVGGRYIVSRVKETLSNGQIIDMYGYAKKQLGKGYDIKFQWSDSKMYCSELVYKVFVAGDMFIAEPKVFSDYNLDSRIVKEAISKRYGNTFNRNEPVITPVDIYKSYMVRTIYDNY